MTEMLQRVIIVCLFLLVVVIPLYSIIPYVIKTNSNCGIVQDMKRRSLVLKKTVVHK